MTPLTGLLTPPRPAAGYARPDYGRADGPHRSDPPAPVRWNAHRVRLAKVDAAMSDTNGADDKTIKYLRLCQELTDRIRAGDWADGRLPTVRELAAEYGVSSFTAYRALQKLQDDGLVTIRKRSGCFVAPVKADGRWAVTSPDLEAAVGWAAAAGAVVVPFADDPGEFLPAVAAAGAGGVVFLPPADPVRTEAFLNACRDVKLPVVLVGRGADGHPGADAVTGDGPAADIARWAVRLLAERAANPDAPPVRVTVAGG